jgi:ectoine hydroxylase-related dioxygenase (phytanoyl-CoA dioxygenase family)
VERKIFKSEHQQDEFDKYGYVVVPFLMEEELRDLKSEFQKLEPSDNFFPKPGPINQSEYHCTFLDDNLEYKKQANDLIRKIFGPGIEKYLADYKILTGNFYVKQPNMGIFEIHQNWPTTQDLDVTTLTIWSPLHDTNVENGTLHLVPGSHKLFPYIENLYYPAFFKEFEEELIREHLIPIELKEGEAIIFCDTLIHWSPKNKSESPRIAVQIETIPKEESPVFYYYDSNNPDQFEMYHTPPEFFETNTIQAFMKKPKGLEFVGRKENPNREISYMEFLELIKSRQKDFA